MTEHPRPAPPSAVLWDMDGTLVDTEQLWMNAEGALVAQFGGTWTPEQALTLVGNGLAASAAILQDAGVQLPAHEIIDVLTDAVMDDLARGALPWRPGALALLAELREAELPAAVVTMSNRRMADLVLSRLPEELVGVFHAVVAGDEASRPKPFPDAYLQACAALGVQPHTAVAIEDSPTGVRAAVSAGVPTIGVPLMVSLVGTGAHELWPTLEGRTLADLATFHAACATAVA